MGVLEDIIKRQKQPPIKLYKNSQCSECKDFERTVKIKQHPITKENAILCRECFKMLQKKNKEKRNESIKFI